MTENYVKFHVVKVYNTVYLSFKKQYVALTI